MLLVTKTRPCSLGRIKVFGLCNDQISFLLTQLNKVDDESRQRPECIDRRPGENDVLRYRQIVIAGWYRGMVILSRLGNHGHSVKE